MRNVFFSILFLLTTLLCSTFSFAGNEHEHLQYLPRYEDIQKAMGGRLGNLPASTIFSKQPLLLHQLYGDEVIQGLLPPEIHLYENGKFNTFPISKYLEELTRHNSILSLSEKISKISSKHPTSLNILKSFFELNPTHINTFNGYMATSSIRNDLFFYHPEIFQSSVKHYLNSAKKSENLKTLFTVPDFMMKSEVLLPIQKMFQEKGLQTQFFMSITRRVFSQTNFPIDEQLKVFRKGAKEGWISGIDFTGSVRENLESFKDKEKVYAQTKSRLKIFFDESRKSQTSIRIHSFEASNQGVFYEALWDTLAECKTEKCLPSVLRIGHIQELQKEDIKKLSNLKKDMPIVFEANIESNLKVQASEIKKLSSTIENLQQNGFRVVLGADGRGILGESSAFESTLVQLKDAGMSEASLKTLIKDAHLPIRNTRIDKKQLLEWQKERLAVQNRILGVPMHSSGSCPADFMEILRLSFKNAR